MAIRAYVTQASVNKQRYRMDLTLARSNGAYVGVAEIDLFMKVWTTSQMQRFIKRFAVEM